MSREVPHNFDEKVNGGGAPDPLPDDELDIDPADFFDPEEFGFKRGAQARGPWGCLWCKIPLLTKQAMIEHHARHCSEQIKQGNKRWKIKHD